MGGDCGVIAPDLIKKHLARDRAAGGAVEEFQDRRFLVRQPDPLVLQRLHQLFGGRAEQVGPIVKTASSMLSKLRSFARRRASNSFNLKGLTI